MSVSGAVFKASKAEEKRIKAIQFGLLSPDEIVKMAACEITQTRSFDENGRPIDGGINDLRLGSTDKTLNCKTCHCKNNDECPGHFGYIKLSKPVFHTGFISECLKILKCVCYNCKKILIDDYERYAEIVKIKNPKERQLKIYNLCKSKEYCRERKRKNIDEKDGNEKGYDYSKDEYYKPGCNERQPTYKRENLKIIVDFSKKNEQNDENMKNDDSLRVLAPEEVLEIFRKISDDDCRLLGFNPKYSRPDWMIIQNLAVCPPQVRPSVSVDSSLRSQDDLTHQYNQILRSNALLEKEVKYNPSTYQNKFENLQYFVATLMNNDMTSGRATKKSGQPIKAIYARLKGKEGRVRGNLMGKRVDFSARSVISPDPNLQVDELGVPLSIAMNLTFPEVVTELNINKLKQLVVNGPSKYPGANKIRSNDGRAIDLRFSMHRTDEHLEPGYIVERHMQNGDYVIFNRQPSLHKMSMMGHRVHILPYSTFRLNLSVTTPYNADFDGDEMNLHLPQSLESKSEIMNIMHVPKQIVSPQSNRPVMGIVQDTLIGCKVFTERDNFLTYDQVNNLVMWIEDFDISKLPMPCIMSPQPLWSGKQIFSIILPDKLNLTRFREDTPDDLKDKLNLMDNFVQIKNGELIQGIICKKTVGASSGGIVHNIWTEVSPQKTIEFLGNCQKIVNNYLLLKGWTVGISDIICDEETGQKVAETLEDMKENISKILNKAQIGKFEAQPGKNVVDSFEYKANEELNKAGQKAGLVVQKALLPRNHLKNMVSAGSKGNPTNILQIIAFVGQQNVEGKRIPFNFQNRTLPHFLKDDYKSESKGFVENSFLKGLTPQEFYFHAMGGREGIIDTAVKTSQTGYIQRRLMKALEDIMIKYDGTVRNSLGHLMQFLYGEDGMAGEFIEDQKFETHRLNDKELASQYKLIENDDEDEFILFNNLRLFMEDSVIEELRRTDLVQLKCELDAEFDQIKRDRDYVRKHILKGLNSSINIPVNIKTIITYAQNDNKIHIFSKSDINPLYAIRKLQELKESLILIKSKKSKDPDAPKDLISKEGQECALTLFNMVLNYSLCTKNIIFKHRLSKKAFDFVCGEIKAKFEQAIVRPGEMVGSIAAQSIGEPATQMTLNTFHLAGVSAANVTLGVPRLKEVINVAKNLKTPSMMIYLKGKENTEKNEYTTEEILSLKGKMEYTSLLNIVTLSEIYYDPDIRNTIITEDQDIIDEYYNIMWDDTENSLPYISPWLLRLVLDKNYLGLSVDIIENIIKNSVKKGSILIIHSASSSDEKKFHIRLRADPSMDENEREEILSLELLKTFEKRLLTEVSLCGIESVKKVYVRNVKKIGYDNEGNQIKIKKIEKNEKTGKEETKEELPEESMLETDGTNLAKIFEVDEVDFTRTISNDINEIYKVLGIEAVRKSLLNELRNVLKPYGIYVNYRHISILCDFMTQRGVLTSITRHGLNKGAYGPIRKATFEETVEILLEAGIFAEKDDLKGISENVLLGKLTKIGTGSFDLYVDINAFENENKNDGNNGGDSPGGEIYMNSDYNQTPHVSKTPNNVYINSIAMSEYDNTNGFTPGLEAPSVTSMWHNPGSVYNGTISTPEPGKMAPSSPEYNPKSEYYKSPAPYSPMANDENNRGQSQYGVSAYSPSMNSPYASGMAGLNSRKYQQTGNRGINSTYSPTTPGNMRPSSSSPGYIQGSGSGLYNSTPLVQGSGNTSQYRPASPNPYPTSPTYNINSLNSASPFYNTNKENNDDDEEEEEEEEENNDKDKKNN